ncbi:GNAT family N-acetyltransferase [Tumidithrix elongata RA019]|uniref:GNAT family N-acetyltransferase n=1 Tax=Tumidithrix elongata BACA0141 TaxID=2716417 RepID=A0AAW9PT03_9CYAN|nr:GNAT family N-acetyltransferase [Tumidithrix elongata RA019]
MTSNISINNKVAIRKAGIKDAKRIAVLADQLGYSVSDCQLKERLTKISNNDSHIIHVATLKNDDVIGWAHTHTVESILMPTCILLGLVVDRDYRHQGIGRLLMQEVENWALSSGYENVLLRSNIKRKEAHVFYEKIGYSNIKQSITFQKVLSREL